SRVAEGAGDRDALASGARISVAYQAADRAVGARLEPDLGPVLGMRGGPVEVVVAPHRELEEGLLAERDPLGRGLRRSSDRGWSARAFEHRQQIPSSIAEGIIIEERSAVRKVRSPEGTLQHLPPCSGVGREEGALLVAVGRTMRCEESERGHNG